MTNPQAAAGVTAMAKAEVKLGETGLQLRNIDELFRFSQAIAGSTLAPKDFIGKPESVMVAIQMGMEVGLPPMAALQNIAVINGRPSIWGDAQLSIVRSAREDGHKVLEAFEETETNDELEPLFRELCFEDDPIKRKEMKIKIAVMQAKMNRKAEDFGVSCFVRRRGFSEAFSRFTIADSKTANLWGKAGPWTQYPFRMLKARARSFLLRDQFGDALKGMMSREEATDFIDITATSQTSAAPTEFKPAAKAIGPVEAQQNSETDSRPVEAVEMGKAALRSLVAAEPVEVAEVKPNPTVAAGKSGASPAESSGASLKVETQDTPVKDSPAGNVSALTSSSAAQSAAPQSQSSTQPQSEQSAQVAETSGNEFVLPPSLTPAGWLPSISAAEPDAVRVSVTEWLNFEALTEPELLAWCVSRGIAKEGQNSITLLAASKLTGLLKSREMVREEILRGRAAKA